MRIHGTDLETKWRHVANLEHDSLCRAFQLDPIRTRFDLPRSAMGGTSGRGNGTIDGHVLFNGEPIGRLYVVYEGERLRDVDPVELCR